MSLMNLRPHVESLVHRARNFNQPANKFERLVLHVRSTSSDKRESSTSKNCVFRYSLAEYIIL